MWVICVVSTMCCMHTSVCLFVCLCLLDCVIVYWAPGRLLTNIISSLIWESEQKQEGFERAQWFPAAAAAACCWEKTVSCFPLVDSVAAGHWVVVNSTKWGNDCRVMIKKRKAGYVCFIWCEPAGSCRLWKLKYERPTNSRQNWHGQISVVKWKEIMTWIL